MAKNNAEHGLFSNSIFILKFAFETNKIIFLLRIPQITLNAARPFIPIIFLRLILNEIMTGQNMGLLLLYALFFGASTFAANLISILLDGSSAFQTQSTVIKMQKRLGEIIMNMRYSEIEQPQTRDFIALAQDGANFSGILDQIANIVASILTISGVAVIIIAIQPIIFAFIFIVVALRMLTDKKSRKLWGKWQPRYAPIMRKVGYYFNIMKNVEYGKEVRINNLQNWIYGKVNKTAKIYLDATTKHNIELQRNNILASVAAIVQETVAYLVLAYKVVFENMPIGDFSMYMASINTFSNGITGIVGSISELLRLGLFAKWFRKCAESAEAVYMAPQTGQTPLSDKNDINIEFQNVYFKYPNTENMILKDLSLSISSGESLSIVGANGAGKTTFVKLLCRFYEPTQGKILINGVNINTIGYDEYRNLLGVVFQDFKLFAFSVKENISFLGLLRQRGGRCNRTHRRQRKAIQDKARDSFLVEDIPRCDDHALFRRAADLGNRQTPRDTGKQGKTKAVRSQGKN